MKSKSIEYYIAKQATEVTQLMYFIREVILDAHPALTESMKYGVPFYSLKRNICYLTHNKKDGVYIGFIQGRKLSNEQGLLISDGRKQVKILQFESLKDAQQKTSLLNEVLNEAFILDEI